MTYRTIFVLGSPNDAQGRLSAMAVGRADKALEFQREHPGVRITAVGGFGAHFNTSPVPHRELLHRYLRSRGATVDAWEPSDLLSANTVEDAWMIAAFVRAHGIGAYGVVTSRFHMPRCRYVFGCLTSHRPHAFIAAQDPDDLPMAVKNHESTALSGLRAQGGVVVAGVLYPPVS